MTQLSKNFSVEELTRSTTAKLHGIDNTPDAKTLNNLKYLCDNILQPVRDALNQQIIINSGYRCKELNKLVGGRPNSYHIKGQAADIHAANDSQMYTICAACLSCAATDLVIAEKRGSKRWVHVQYSMAPTHTFLIYKR